MTGKSNNPRPTKDQGRSLYRPLERKDFETHQIEAQTFWVNKAIVSKRVFSKLLKAMPARLDEAKRRDFLSDTLTLVQIPLLRKQQKPDQTTYAALQKIEIKARALLQALAVIDTGTTSLLKAGAVDAVYGFDGDDVSVFLARSTNEISITGYFWDAVQGIEKAANAARGLVTPEKGKAHKAAISKAIVITAAQAYLRHFNKALPVSKSGWFAQWVAGLGEEIGHEFSAKQAETALRQASIRC